MVIPTEFDDILENDLILEETEQSEKYADVLKNSENIFKSFLYLKKLMGASTPFVNKILKVETILAPALATVTILDTTGKILLKNTKTDANSSFFVNDGEFILLPTESAEIPIDNTYKLEIIGNFSMIQAEYHI